ncbi:MAG TPA: hypothetical protein VE422_24225 [Terriglobia bacterium]|nr:hypothetical protein [Terriglobia bacterium]
MLLACLPARYAHYMSDISFDNEVSPDGQAKYVPHGLRIIESLPDQVEVPSHDMRPVMPEAY